jgi:pectin methylesterase-like acyl-CoA thioesterase
LIALAALSKQAFASSSATVGLCAGPGNHYTTIQAAVNAPGVTTVEVCPGTYPEQVTITQNLTLKGIASGTSDAAVVVVPAGGLVTNGVTDISGSPTAAQIFVQGATVTISHLTVDGANDGLTDCSIDAIGIYYQNASGTITDNAVRNVLLPPALQGCQDGLAINVESNTTSTVTVSNNSVRNYDKNGSYCQRT